jgi:quinol monooxygenase YgiN
MGQTVIVAYRPKAGKEAELLELIRTHVPTLRKEGLATDAPVVVMRAAGGTLLEVFEWQSAEAIAASHQNEAVQAMWGRFAEACDYEYLASLDECKQLFATFETVPL